MTRPLKTNGVWYSVRAKPRYATPHASRLVNAIAGVTVTDVTVDYDCGKTYTAPTVIPECGSALHHASAVDTVIRMVDTQHYTECRTCYPLCWCGRSTDRRGKTCCQMCWIGGYGTHSRLCRKRNGTT